MALTMPDVGSNMVKRLFDIIFSLAGIVVLSPVLLLAALLVKLDSKGPVFFRQERIGRNFVPFRIIKFRTMVADADRRGPLVTSGGDSRITRAGRFLRRSKLDEIPQLFNVLKGEMSLVGPRPEVAKYVEIFRPAYAEILEARPGITDFAALEYCDEEEVLKRYEDPEEGYVNEVLPAKIDLYRKYQRERGFLTDVKLIVMTVAKILRSS